MEAMNATRVLIELLRQTPIVLEHLLAQIPGDRYDCRRSENAWGVNEWLGHLVDAQHVLIGRFAQFESEEDPLIGDYEPPPQSDDRYRGRRCATAVSEFADLRSDTIRQLASYSEAYWDKRGRHDSFSPYGTRILLGHMLNVDHAHLFSIESAGLAKVESLR